MFNECKEINRFYRSETWKLPRLQKIVSVNGRCEKCDAAGEEVHHIIRLTPEDVNDPDVSLNLQNLILSCKDFHNREHGRFKKLMLN